MELVRPGTLMNPRPVDADGAAFSARGVTFDGADTMARGATILAADNSNGLLSFWYNIANGFANMNVIDAIYNPALDGSSYGFRIRLNASPARFQFIGKNAGATSFVQVEWAVTADGNWHNAIFNYNTNFGAGAKVAQCAIDGTVQAEAARSDGASAFALGWSAVTDTRVGKSSGDGYGNLVGSLAELYFNPGTAKDLTNPANVALFYNASKPVDLGANGSNPTGSAPEVYLSVRGGGVATDFLTNRGTAGNFSMTAGALTLSATNP